MKKMQYMTQTYGSYPYWIKGPLCIVLYMFHIRTKPLLNMFSLTFHLSLVSALDFINGQRYILLQLIC